MTHGLGCSGQFKYNLVYTVAHHRHRRKSPPSLPQITEDEPILPPLKKEQPKNRWDDEDVDENDVKDSWEDEEETALVSYTDGDEEILNLRNEGGS